MYAATSCIQYLYPACSIVLLFLPYVLLKPANLSLLLLILMGKTKKVDYIKFSLTLSSIEEAFARIIKIALHDFVIPLLTSANNCSKITNNWKCLFYTKCWLMYASDHLVFSTWGYCQSNAFWGIFKLKITSTEILC